MEKCKLCKQETLGFVVRRWTQRERKLLWSYIKRKSFRKGRDTTDVYRPSVDQNTIEPQETSNSCNKSRHPFTALRHSGNFVK